MSHRLSIDVMVTVHSYMTAFLDCVERLLDDSGEQLCRLILIDDLCLDPNIVESVRRVANQDVRLQLVRDSSRLGPVDSCNRLIAESQRDVVFLRGDCMVSHGWLSELAAVAHSEERTACASPLTNGEGTCSVPAPNRTIGPEDTDPSLVRTACHGLPRWTISPELDASCIYLRRSVIDAVGLLNSRFESPHAAVNDWVTRSQSLGFLAKRANHVYVPRLLPRLGGNGEPMQPDRDPTQLVERERHLVRRAKMFCGSLDGQLAAHAVRTETTGKLRVAYDIRHLTRAHMGTRTYAVSLANALAELPEIDLTLIVLHESQAEDLKGRIVTPETWADDVAVIHKPAQVGEATELRLLFDSCAHVVITYQDLIAYRIPVAFSSDADFDAYRATSRLSVQAAQRIIAYSENASREITAEFGNPNEEITVTPLGVETAWFGRREPDDQTILQEMRTPARFFFSLAADYPHKNLLNLLDAYVLFRRGWRGSEPPGLVLAGYASKARTGFYTNLESNPPPEGLMFLGPVGPDQLRVLYQNAEALVFPSLYEGFGLPPLEAMAAGTPVIAMPISSVPEVGGDSVLYPDGLSAVHLARAMEAIATNMSLRDDLRERGLRRVEQFRWENTARATLEAYRSAVMRPSPRSLQMRRNLRDGILRWAIHFPHDRISQANEPVHGGWEPESMGIRDAFRAIGVALNARLKRELRIVR